MEAEPVLEVKDLCLSRVFKDVSFAIQPGEILGITGLLGSGRTEFALSLYGVHPATSGSIRLNGQEIKVRSIQEAGKYGISYLPEDRLTEGLCLPQSIFRNIHLSTLGNYTRRGILQNDNMQTAADGWVKTFSIATKNTDNAVATLSGGNQQKVVDVYKRQGAGRQERPPAIALNTRHSCCWATMWSSPRQWKSTPICFSQTMWLSLIHI